MDGQDPKVLAEDAAEKALSAVTALIIATLRESAPTRFQEAQRLCEVAQSLIKARGRRAADFKGTAPQQDQNQMYGDNAGMVFANNAGGIVQNVRYDQMLQGEVGNGPDPYAGQQNENPPNRRPPGRILFDEQGNLLDERGMIWAGHIDSNALMRHMLMAFGPHAQTGVEANRARVAAEEAIELKALINLMDGIAPEKVVPAEKVALWEAIKSTQAPERRIKQLLSNLERRSNGKPAEAPQAPEVPVVPPDDPRGHPPGEGGAEANPPPRLAAHGVGDLGDGGPPQARPVNGVGTDAMVS